MKKEIVVFILISIIIAMLTITVSIVKGDATISSGACFDVTSNDTINNTFQVCAANMTTNQTFYNFTLYSGEHKTDTGYDLTCIGNITPSSKCILDDVAEIGEEYNYESAYCDIEIDVEDIRPEDCRDMNITTIDTTHTSEYHIQYSNTSKRIQFNFGEKESIWNIDESIDIKGSMDFTCPMTILNNTVATQVTADQCRALSQIYCGGAFDIITQKFDQAEIRRVEYESKLENCRLDKTRMVENSVCVTNDQYAQLLADSKLQKNVTEDCQTKTGGLQQQIRQKDSFNNELIFMAFILFAGNIIQYFYPQLFRKKVI